MAHAPNQAVLDAILPLTAVTATRVKGAATPPILLVARNNLLVIMHNVAAAPAAPVTARAMAAVLPLDVATIRPVTVDAGGRTVVAARTIYLLAGYKL